MARQEVASMFAVALIVGAFASLPTSVQSIGVVYGVLGNNLPSRSDVVQLYWSYGITDMRIYFVDKQALDAMRNSSIGLIFGTTSEDVGTLAASQLSAVVWVHTNVVPYYPDVNIKYIAVGNELTSGDSQSILTAMRNLDGALDAAGLGGIKVSTSVRFDVITNSFPPSKAVFKDPSVMVPIAQFLSNTGAPLLANVYPYLAYRDNPGDFTLCYALFQPSTPVRDDGNGLVYTNLFDAMVDAVYTALEKAGATNVSVVVSETGWPSDGGLAATVENARTYNQGVIDHVAHGTPKRPGQLETYISAIFNENQKTGNETEKHFGLFYPNKWPVYRIQFS